jgi:hypothetical protein
MNEDLWQKLSSAYDYVNTVLWAFLAAFLVYFTIYIIPHIQAAQEQTEARRLSEIAAEHEAFCLSLEMGAGASAHQRCLRTVQAFRASVERQTAEDSQF